MLGPFATSRLTPIHQMSLAVLSRAACASMSTTTPTTTTTRDRGDRYGPMEWAQLYSEIKKRALCGCDVMYRGRHDGPYVDPVSRPTVGVTATACLRSVGIFGRTFGVPAVCRRVERLTTTVFERLARIFRQCLLHTLLASSHCQLSTI